MRFSLVHPSRGRPAQAEEAVREWHTRHSGRAPLEHIVSIDTDDPDLASYRALADRLGLRLTVNANRTMVDATNAGAAMATGDVIVVVSDDFGCPDRWDQLLETAIGSRSHAAVLVHDGIHGRILTLPVLTRAWYAALGFVYHPAYVSMYADDDLTAIAAQEGVLVDARYLTFPHRHHSTGLSVEDATYQRQDGKRAWWHGWRVFQKRRIEAFGSAPRTLRVRLAQAGVDIYYWLRVGGARFRRWLRPRLGQRSRVLEARVRTAVLRWLRRLTAAHGTDV